MPLRPAQTWALAHEGNCSIMAILVVLQSSYMDQTRIAALLAPFIGDFDNEKLLADISTYIDILLRWNSRLDRKSVV